MKNKTTLLGASLFSLYFIYIIIDYIKYYNLQDKYGNVYYEMYIYPHLVFIFLGIVLNFIYYFKENKYIKYIMIISYILGIIFLFIKK